MSRKPRCIRPGRLYEVTLTTFQSRFFFIPSPLLNALVIGVLAYCQLKYSLRFCFAVFLSNHGHLLIRADSPEQVRSFLCLSKSQIAQEVQKLCKWSGGIFEPNSPITEVTPDAQEDRLRYLLSQGLKEGLVPHPSKWPGVHSVKALMTGAMRLRGKWIRRSDKYEVDRRRKRAKGSRAQRNDIPDRVFEDTLYLELSPLPVWDDLEPKEVAKRTREIVQELLEEHREKKEQVREDYRKHLMDKSRFCHRPEDPPKNERPKVHAGSKGEWQAWVEVYDDWCRRYRAASARLRQGIVKALDEFPECAFLPTGLYPAQGLPPPEPVS